MKKIMVQDDSREKQMADMFNLNREGGRIGVDAVDENKNQYELKTTTKGGVSTARDLGPNHLEKWRLRYWIIQTGKNTKKGFVHTVSYFFAPEHMEEWYKKIEEKLDNDIKLADMVKIKLLVHNDISEDHIARVLWLMHRGKLMNDPNISSTYIKENGIIIKNDCPKELRKLVKKYPIIKKKMVNKKDKI